MMLRQGTLVSENVGAQVSVEAPKAIDFLLESTALFRTLPLKAQSFVLASGETDRLGRDAFHTGDGQQVKNQERFLRTI